MKAGRPTHSYAGYRAGVDFPYSLPQSRLYGLKGISSSSSWHSGWIRVCFEGRGGTELWAPSLTCSGTFPPSLKGVPNKVLCSYVWKGDSQDGEELPNDCPTQPPASQARRKRIHGKQHGGKKPNHTEPHSQTQQYSHKVTGKNGDGRESSSYTGQLLWLWLQELKSLNEQSLSDTQAPILWSMAEVTHSRIVPGTASRLIWVRLVGSWSCLVSLALAWLDLAAPLGSSTIHPINPSSHPSIHPSVYPPTTLLTSLVSFHTQPSILLEL